MTASTDDTSGLTTDTPDWESLGREIVCPLCDYNLRGLAEPCCPECGHRSSWDELLAISEEQPWFFESARKRRARALLRTWALAFLPRAFWRSIRPQLPPQMSRLATFLVANVVALAVVGSWKYTSSYVKIVWILRERAAMTPPGLPAPQYPKFPWDPQVLGEYDLNRPFQIELALTFVLCLWPWLTAATLFIFQQTLKKARIKPMHVIRCAIYSGAAGVLVVHPLSWWIASIPSHWAYHSVLPVLEPAMIWPLGTLMALMTYRLWTAYRLYMRFPHALATVVASQLIVTITVFIIFASLSL